MASTTYEAFDGHQGRLCFDTNGNVVATRGLRVPAPWMVLTSKKFSGRKKKKERIPSYASLSSNHFVMHFSHSYLPFSFLYFFISFFTIFLPSQVAISFITGTQMSVCGVCPVPWLARPHFEQLILPNTETRKIIYAQHLNLHHHQHRK
jgi:hypothetical protein